MEEKQESIEARIAAEKDALVARYNAGDLAGALEAQARMYALIHKRRREADHGPTV